MDDVVIIGAGPAGRAAAGVLPGARVIARPAATVWHAQDRMLWIETAAGVARVAFGRLLLCADEPLLLAALGCAFQGMRAVVDAHGRTSVAGVFAAGRVLGAATAEAAAAQGGIAARALAGLAPGGEIAVAGMEDVPAAARRDPVAMAELLAMPAGPARDRAVLAQLALLGAVTPARPVGFAALAEFDGAVGAARPPQTDAGILA